MINILEASNFLNRKNNFPTDSKSSVETNKQMFSDVFNSEKRNLLYRGQSVARGITYNDKNKNLTDQTNISNNTIKSDNKSEPDITGNKVSSETKQYKKCKDIDTDETMEKTEDEPTDKDIILSLQSILLVMLENILNLENKNVKVNVEELQDLNDLKEQLICLLETTDILLMDNSFKQNIEELVDIINKTGDEILLDTNDQLTIFKTDQIINNLGKLKDNMQSVLNRPNIGKSDKQSKLHVGDNFLNLKEQVLAEDGETLLKDDNADEKVKNNIKIANKIYLTDSNEQLFKQLEEDNETVFRDQIIAHQQKTTDQIIDLKITKGQIINPKQFISEIAQKAGTFILKDKNEMSIQLRPENLGKLSIKIGLNEGTLTGKIYAENYSVKEIIEANLNQLQDSLKEQGLSIAGLEVYINDSSQGFERDLYQSTFTNKYKSKVASIKINNDIAMLEQNINETNPYLNVNQFDSLV